jgi:hypothetical protein
METLYIIIGVVSSVLVFLLGYLVKATSENSRDIGHLDTFIEQVNSTQKRLERDFYENVERIEQRMGNSFEDIDRRLDSRVDKSISQFEREMDLQSRVIEEIQTKVSELWVLNQNLSNK